ncbi:MAG TPA: hypothetical protein VLM76_10595 [Patescibacteria group bacterium]|nr:hypothetical protein [Patescibacteria group bacterium]
MTSFTPADHVTQREEGPWRDCLFASLIEVLRLGLPGGRAISAEQPEVERLRAAAGLPDDHPGATIAQALPAAGRLYGLAASQYTLTRDWTTLTAALDDPGKLAVVTGLLAAVPAAERITSFTGPHAVAKHGLRVRCDPLGPRDGRYRGNTWTLATWRAFTAGLAGWEALIMDKQEATMLTLGGITVTSSRRARTLRSTPLLRAPAGTRVLTAPAGRIYPLLGADGEWRLVIGRTAIGYADGVARDTGLWVRAVDVAIEDAPPRPATTDTGPAVSAAWRKWITTHPK